MYGSVLHLMSYSLRMVMAAGMADKRRSRGSVLSTTGVTESHSSSTGARVNDAIHFGSHRPSLCCPPPPDKKRRHLTFKQYAIQFVKMKNVMHFDRRVTAEGAHTAQACNLL